MGSEGQSKQWKSAFVMVAVNFGFASGNVFLKKILDEGMNHLVIISCRLLTSAIFLSPIAYFLERSSRPKLTFKILFQLFFSGLIGVALAQYFFLLGLGYTSATFLSAFINMVPVTTFLLALPFGLEKVHMRSLAGRTKVLGTLVCAAGAILLALYKGMPLTNPDYLKTQANLTISTSKTERWAMGSVYLIAGCISWSSWFLMQARIGRRYPCQYSSTAIMASFGAIQSAILGLIIDRNPSGWVLKQKLEIIGVIYSGMVGSGLCYVGMSWSVKQKGPVFTSAFSPVIQIFGALFDFSILHEPLYLGSVLGSILVIIGLYSLLWGKSKEIDHGCEMKEAQVAQSDEHKIPITTDPTATSS